MRTEEKEVIKNFLRKLTGGNEDNYDIYDDGRGLEIEIVRPTTSDGTTKHSTESSQLFQNQIKQMFPMLTSLTVKDIFLAKKKAAYRATFKLPPPQEPGN